jgi:hypothetical protein
MYTSLEVCVHLYFGFQPFCDLTVDNSDESKMSWTVSMVRIETGNYQNYVGLQESK